MKASMLAKAGPTGPPVGPSPKHRPLGPTGGSPLRAATPSSAAPPAPPAPAASEDDDVSDYTDADESISAPTEFLAEFLSAIMGKDYPTALKYCKLILQYEPNNRTAREFYPLIVEKLVQSTIDEDLSNSADDSSSGGSGSMTGSDEDDDSDLSVDEEEDEEGEDDDKDGCGLGSGRRRHEHNDNSSVEFGDTDGTTASYSSLEDEEADPTDICRDTITAANDNEDVGNGNEVPGDAETLAALIQTTRFSDSESPTEPVSQRLISGLRAKVIPTRR